MDALSCTLASGGFYRCPVGIPFYLYSSMVLAGAVISTGFFMFVV